MPANDPDLIKAIRALTKSVNALSEIIAEGLTDVLLEPVREAGRRQRRKEKEQRQSEEELRLNLRKQTRPDQRE